MDRRDYVVIVTVFMVGLWLYYKPGNR